MEENRLYTYIKFIPMRDDCDPLTYATKFSSGIDLRAYLPLDHVLIKPLETMVFSTGYKMWIHPDFEFQVRSRGGLAAKNGIFVLNSPGTVDADYEGEVKIILFNTSNKHFLINHGDKIAQGVICPIVREMAYMPDNLKERGEGRFGSTGV